jgi:4-hydroxy-tetrahydrodipicolinate synthase
MATPLNAGGRLDAGSLERLVEHELAGGVSGLFILGTTGEGPHLEARLREEVVKRVCAQVAGRVPVLVGLCDTSTESCVELAKYSAGAGASALVLTPPFYMPLGQGELLEYLLRVIPRLELPVFLYNIPGLTKIHFAPETLKRAVERAPLAGLKDSSGDMEYFAAVRAALPASTGFGLFCGPEEQLLESLDLGGDGGVCGGANLFPRLYTEMYRLAREGRRGEAGELQQRVLRLSAVVYAQTKESTSYLRGVKAAMSVLGLCQPYLAEPLSALPEENVARIREFLSGAEWRSLARAESAPAAISE